ncbi:MAG: pyruvate dehydrogenase (acetyl-transferring) E1 component subunit alpha [Planctomycetota bacterium]|jgi:2-oxoisovalerate dehydrogenase E1 component alpha subunit
MSSEVLTVLAPDGKVRKKDLPDLTDDQLREMFRLMVLTRALDDRGMNLQRQGRAGFYLPSRGEEGLQIGCALALRPDDWVFPSYRIPGLALARGADPQTLLDQIFGNENDVCRGRQMPVHYSLRQQNFVSISSPIGTRIPQAVGAALAMRYLKQDSIAMAFFGDGGTSSDGFHLGLNFGAVYAAPVVFFCQNNQWAISVPIEKQTRSESIAIKAKAYGMPGVRVDGNDVLAVYQATKEAVERARRGEGPTLVEALTFRMGPHSSSDDPTRYRPGDVVEEWEAKDPIARFAAFLEARGLFSEEFDAECAETAKRELSEAAKRAEKAGPPPVEDLFTDVYAEPTPELNIQRDGLLRLVERGELTGKDEGFFPL